MAYIGQPVSTLVTIPNSGVTAGTYGNSTIVPVITIGADGRVTSAANVTITTSGGGGGGSITITNDTSSNVDTFYPLLSNGTTSGTLSAANTSSTKLYYNANTGTLSATNFNSLSDRNLKDNIVIISDATNAVSQIEGVEFNWKDNGKKSAGFIAQELEKILPHLVDTGPDGTKTINYSGVIAYLVQTVKELDTRLKNLEK